MGYCLLGLAVLTPMGMVGSYYQMLGHGISSSAMFFTVGVIYERAHHRDLNRFGGLALQMPMYTGLAMVAFFASLGLPGLCGFPGEALTFFGAFPVVPVFTCIAVVGVVLTAVYILWTIQRVYLGKIPGAPETDAHGHDAHGGGHGHDPGDASHDAGHGHHAHATYEDAKPWENGVLFVLAALAVILGVFPSIFINIVNGKLSDIINMVLPYASK
jgi:NADH-quinone oxidoreductase subunit M